MADTDFARRGVHGPIRILARQDAHRALTELVGSGACPLDWGKGWAAASRPYYALAGHPAIIARVVELLGPNVLLWGASLVRREPGVVHAWHSDLESAAPDGRTVSVWLGLKHCTAASSLAVIPGSQHYGRTLQEVRAAARVERAASGPADALAWATAFDPSAAIETIATEDGEAVFFDGRIWHGSDNRSPNVRTALLLQYAVPDTPIRIPASYDWPYVMLDTPLPPCLLVHGEDRSQVNRVVPAPAASGASRGPRLTSHARPLALPLDPGNAPWKPFPIFRGTTAGLRSITCHVSALAPDHSPHPPHTHDDEEVLIVLSGEADVILPALAGADARQRLRAGDGVYYPAHFPHTLEGTGDAPVNYLMIKWIGDPTGASAPLGFRRFRCEEPADQQPGFRVHRLFDGPTGWLHRLECHVSTMAPGAGYPPHADAHDVAMVMLDGTLESLGQRLTPHGVFFYAAGELHGAGNPGPAAARYLVFEFHALPTVRRDDGDRVPLLRKVTDPDRWRRKVGALARRIRRRLSPARA